MNAISKINWKYEIGESVSSSTKKNKAQINLTIIDKKIKPVKVHKKGRTSGYQNKNEKWYKYHCNICGNEDWISESNLVYSSVGCNVCGYNSQKVLAGYNDIATVAPQLIKYIDDTVDYTKFSAYSTSNILCKCPICGHKKEIAVYNLNTYGFSCPICSDGYSYPEKFISQFLQQLNVQFISEYNKKHAPWIGKYRYDFYLPDYNCIIEVHGAQHYEPEKFHKRDLEEIQTIDNLKQELAIANNIKTYIVIDARKSQLHWLKTSIINSSLNSMFDLSIINWKLCDEIATKTRVKEICDLWESGCSVKELASQYHCSNNTIVRYLHKGYELGWCSYTSNSEYARTKQNIKWPTKAVSVLFNNIVLGEFASTKLLCEKSAELFFETFSNEKISLVCNKKRKYHKGFSFEFIEKNQFPTTNYILTQSYNDWVKEHKEQ